MIYFDSQITMNEITIACDTLACVLVPDTQGNMVVTPRAAMEPVNTPTKEKAKYMLVAPRSAMTTNPISANNQRWFMQCIGCGAWFSYDKTTIEREQYNRHDEGIDCEHCGRFYYDRELRLLHDGGIWLDPRYVTDNGQIK